MDLHLTLFWAIVFASCQNVSILFSSPSVDRLQLVFVLPGFLFPCGLYSRACLIILVGSYPSCMSNPSPLSSFDLNVNRLLFCLFPLVCICYFIVSPYPQDVSEAVINKHLQFVDDCFGGFTGFTAIEEDRLCLSWKFWFLCFWRAEKRAIQVRVFWRSVLPCWCATLHLFQLLFLC